MSGSNHGKIFVGGLSWNTTQESLRDYFQSKYGLVNDCVVIIDPNTGRSRGFGFVTFDDESCVEACIQDSPHQLDNREVNAAHAHERQK